MKLYNFLCFSFCSATATLVYAPPELDWKPVVNSMEVSQYCDYEDMRISRSTPETERKMGWRYKATFTSGAFKVEVSGLGQLPSQEFFGRDCEVMANCIANLKALDDTPIIVVTPYDKTDPARVFAFLYTDVDQLRLVKHPYTICGIDVNDVSHETPDRMAECIKRAATEGCETMIFAPNAQTRVKVKEKLEQLTANAARSIPQSVLELLEKMPVDELAGHLHTAKMLGDANLQGLHNSAA